MTKYMNYLNNNVIIISYLYKFVNSDMKKGGFRNCVSAQLHSAFFEKTIVFF